MNFEAEYRTRQTEINSRLDQYLNPDNYGHLVHSREIIDAMRYSVLAGGKRLRPILLLSAHNMVEGNLDESLPLACALEMIHNYSLIHDDLPAMDDDDYRRGKATTHIKYGEAMGILAGDALLNMAYEIMIKNASNYPDNIHNHVAAMETIANAAGVNGMISGQVADLHYEGKDIDTDAMEFIHSHKTAALIKASVISGIELEDVDRTLLEAMECYGVNIGLAFQIRDDILDVIGDFQDLGKRVGSDSKNEKSTYPSLYGLEKSKVYMGQLIEEAIDVLEPFGSKAEFLKQLALTVGNRKN